MKILVTGGVALVVLISFFVMRDWAFNKMVNSLLSDKVEMINPEEVKLKNYIILDAREKNEFEVSHLPGAVWVGFDDFDINRVEASKDQDILVYCSIGKRSDDIALKMQDKGFTNVKNLHGGIFKWANQKFELQNEFGNTNKVHTYNLSWSIWVKNVEKVY